MEVLHARPYFRFFAVLPQLSDGTSGPGERMVELEVQKDANAVLTAGLGVPVQSMGATGVEPSGPKTG